MTILKHSKYCFGIFSVFTILVTGLHVPETSNPEASIANVIKKTLNNKSTSHVTKMMKDHLVQMKLISCDDVWANKEIKKIGHKLLPRNLNGQHLAELVDKMAENAANNPYLHSFLKQAIGPDFEQLTRLVELDGDLIFPDVLAFAMVLERLTRSMEEDWRTAQACHEVWKKDLTIRKLSKHLSVFEIAKTVSIKKAIENKLEIIRTKKVDPNHGQYMLPINILEAMAEDVRHGYLDNAKTAWTLAKHKPGGSKNVATGSGPTMLSEDGKYIEIHLPLGKEWADLYQTWNLAFVSQFEKFPYYMAKLLIPSVSNYQAAPEGYLHSRGYALYTFINWVLQGRWQGTAPKMNWATRDVTKNWGLENAKSSKDYELKIAELQPTILFDKIIDGAIWFVGAVSWVANSFF